MRRVLQTGLCPWILALATLSVVPADAGGNPGPSQFRFPFAAQALVVPAEAGMAWEGGCSFMRANVVNCLAGKLSAGGGDARFRLQAETVPLEALGTPMARICEMAKGSLKDARTEVIKGRSGNEICRVGNADTELFFLKGETHLVSWVFQREGRGPATKAEGDSFRATVLRMVTDAKIENPWR
jgi:hypothetical protein